MTLDTRFAINCRVLDSFNSCVHYIWHTQPYTNLTIQTTDQVRWNYAGKKYDNLPLLLEFFLCKNIVVGCYTNS